MNFNFYEAFLIFIRGLLMGSADIVPGVSGGTMALITGIYGHLIEAISNIKFGFLKPLFKGDFKGSWNKLLEEFDFEFLIPLVLGIGVAFLTLAKVVTYCMDVHTALTFSFFLGLIIASAVVLFKKLNKISLTCIIFAAIGCILTYMFVSLNPIAANHSLIVLFFFRNDCNLCYDFAWCFRILFIIIARTIQIHVKCPSSTSFYRNNCFYSWCINRYSRIFKNIKLFT